MTGTSIETFQWEQLARRQKIYIVGALMLLVSLIGYGVFDHFRLTGAVRESENAAIKAEREKDDALAEASKIATQVKVREEELAKVEVKRDAKKQEVEKAKSDVADARAGYDAAVKHRRPDAPSTDELCAYLAANGHPCQPQ